MAFYNDIDLIPLKYNEVIYLLKDAFKFFLNICLGYLSSRSVR